MINKRRDNGVLPFFSTPPSLAFWLSLASVLAAVARLGHRHPRHRTRPS